MSRPATLPGRPRGGAATGSDLDRRARQFHALSDPTRLRILEWLTAGERCVCELQADLDAAQSRLSFHLKTLRDAGLIRGRRAGRWMFYSTVASELEGLAAALGELHPTTTAPVCDCGDVVSLGAGQSGARRAPDA